MIRVHGNGTRRYVTAIVPPGLLAQATDLLDVTQQNYDITEYKEGYRLFIYAPLFYVRDLLSTI